MAYIGKEPQIGNYQICDAISVVNGQAAYTMQVSSTNVSPESANHMLVSLNGILQKPGSSFTISGSTLTFASNLATGDVIDFVILLGNVLDLGTVSDGTITNAKLAQDIISGETALTDPPATTDELLLSDAGTLKRIDYSLISNTPAFEAVGTAVNISDATTTKLQFSSERLDTDGCYDNSTNYRFTPTVAGKYFIYSTCQLRSDTSNTIDGCFLHIYKNGSYVTKAAEENQASRHFGNCLTTNTIVDMNGSSDYVEVYGYIDVSSGQPSQPADNRCIFGGYRITG